MVVLVTGSSFFLHIGSGACNIFFSFGLQNCLNFNNILKIVLKPLAKCKKVIFCKKIEIHLTQSLIAEVEGGILSEVAFHPVFRMLN